MTSTKSIDGLSSKHNFAGEQFNKASFMLRTLFSSLSLTATRRYRAVGPLIAMANRPRRNLPTAAQAASLATTIQSTEAAFESFVDAQPATTATSVKAESDAGSSMSSPASSPLSEAAAEEPVKPARKKRVKKEPELDEDGNVIKKPRAKRTPAPPEYDEDGNVIKKKRKMKPKPPIVYVIPDVKEKKTTTFKGRLGYACLNVSWLLCMKGGD
jgi:hypothetical protein